MPRPRVCVLRAPGTNCDRETAFAFEQCRARVERVHLFRLLAEPQRLKAYEILCIPGGFSYGDDVGAGVIFGSRLKNRLADEIGEFLSRDTLTLGICNGFQVLLKAGILPEGGRGWQAPARHEPQATLTWNANGRYTDLWVKLRVCSPTNMFLRGIETLECPIAHAEGRLVVKEAAVVERWKAAGQVAVCYAAEDQDAPTDLLLPDPINPNGSVANIAGLGESTGRVLGLMPHPERFLFATQHPQWTRRRLRGEGLGFQIFRNAVTYFG